MPRPGPRPYECVRRAWHSDRHQPVRGSIIKEIFRVANDVHSPDTRKNNEWQEKLPFVVLKAEEIMYSKANSEAEYVDLKTLRERVIDAIDTIIRKDDTTESGDLLQPCIEAALNLGCVPRRVSKSQHRSNLGCYLSPITSDVRAASLNISNSNRGNLRHLLRTTPDLGNLQNSALESSSWYPAFFKPTNMTCSSIPEIKYNNSDVYHGHLSSFSINRSECPMSTRPSPPSCQQRFSLPTVNFTCPNLAGGYPLHYSDNQHEVVSRIATAVARRAGSLEEAEISFAEILTGSKNTIGASKGDSIFMENSNVGWDLSLRLGLPSTSSFGGEITWTN